MPLSGHNFVEEKDIKIAVNICDSNSPFEVPYLPFASRSRDRQIMQPETIIWCERKRNYIGEREREREKKKRERKKREREQYIFSLLGRIMLLQDITRFSE